MYFKIQYFRKKLVVGKPYESKIKFIVFQRVNTYFNSASKITFWLLLVIMIWTTLNLKKWKHAETNAKIITWDVTSYYGYLPAIFIHHDLSLDFIDTDGVNYSAKHQFWPERLNRDLERDPAGEIKVIKTTMGMSFMYAPFFFMAHGFAYLSKYESNGFSQPYEFFLVLSCLFYLFIGLFFLRKLLLFTFSEWVTSLTMVTVLAGTNLYYYASAEPAMSHAFSFSLITCFIFQSILWLTEQNFKRAVYLGLLLGLIVLIRPVNILIFLFPLLYGVYTKKLFIERMQFFIAKYLHIMAIVFLFFIVLSPQLVYWKYITGSWLFNSYVNERFYFNNQHILEGLFSYRKGWLVYTPIMIFAFIGLLSLFKIHRKYFLSTAVFLLINIIVLYSWWSWWYGGGFGSRPMIDSYGLLAIPIASFYSVALKKRFTSIPILLIVALLIALNQIQTFQYRRCIIHWDAMTEKAYWGVFLKMEMSADDWVCQERRLQKPDQEKAIVGEDEYNFDPF